MHLTTNQVSCRDDKIYNHLDMPILIVTIYKVLVLGVGYVFLAALVAKLSLHIFRCHFHFSRMPQASRCPPPNLLMRPTALVC